MSAPSEEARERQKQARARARLRQRIERARWRCGRSDWMVAATELDAILAGEKPKKAEYVTAHVSEPLPVEELPEAPPQSADHVFNLIRGGVRTWDALVKQSRLSEDRLGLVLADLLNDRRIRAHTTGEARIYEAVR